MLAAALKALYATINAHQSGGSCSSAGTGRRVRGTRQRTGRTRRTQWSGDQSGTWDYIRWQIPTYAGATMSGLARTTGDVDGIFGGSAKTYTRDLQWKMFLGTTMTMDGWAASDKHPFRYGEPYTSMCI
jgi:hypothetical protein